MNCMAFVMRDILICHQTCIVMVGVIRATCFFSTELTAWGNFNFAPVITESLLPWASQKQADG